MDCSKGQQPDASDRPVIIIDADEPRVIDEAMQAIAGRAYQRGGQLVQAVRDELPKDGISRAAGSVIVKPMTPANVREALGRAATIAKAGKDGPIRIHPPAWLVSGLHSRCHWSHIKQLVGVSESPVLRSDGTVCETPGYDRATGILCDIRDEFPTMPRHPELDDAHRAVDEIFEAVCDFKFDADEHRSAWMAGLLTLVGRSAFDGPAPCFLIDANVRGAGKGLLAQVIGYIAMGRELPVGGYAHDPDEMAKRITSVVLAADAAVLLDNIEGAFGNSAIDRVLTGQRWQERLLGTNVQIDLPTRAIWFGTGNNIQVAADTSRRVIHIRLDVLDERPEERSGWRHPNLLAWVRENRPRLLVRALTILAAFIRAGRPSHSLTPFGSFEGWSDLVRQSIVWCGLPDPCKTRAALVEASDSTHDALAELLRAWREYDPWSRGIVVGDMLREFYSSMILTQEQLDMRAAVEACIGCPPGKAPTARQIGAYFKKFRRRVVGGAMFDADKDAGRRSGAVWKIIYGPEGTKERESRESCESSGTYAGEKGEVLF